jgi:hypothetical protein
MEILLIFGLFLMISQAFILQDTSNSLTDQILTIMQE